jgi:hypothetical protein
MLLFTHLIGGELVFILSHSHAFMGLIPFYILCNALRFRD